MSEIIIMPIIPRKYPKAAAGKIIIVIILPVGRVILKPQRGNVFAYSPVRL
jgi:hypothetical protein